MFESKSITDAKWCGDVCCIPQPKVAGSRAGCVVEPPLKSRKAVGVCVPVFFHLNPRTEQNPRNGREGDKRELKPASEYAKCLSLSAP